MRTRPLESADSGRGGDWRRGGDRMGDSRRGGGRQNGNRYGADRREPARLSHIEPARQGAEPVRIEIFSRDGALSIRIATPKRWLRFVFYLVSYGITAVFVVQSGLVDPQQVAAILSSGDNEPVFLAVVVGMIWVYVTYRYVLSYLGREDLLFHGGVLRQRVRAGPLRRTRRIHVGPDATLTDKPDTGLVALFSRSKFPREGSVTLRTQGMSWRFGLNLARADARRLVEALRPMLEAQRQGARRPERAVPVKGPWGRLGERILRKPRTAAPTEEPGGYSQPHIANHPTIVRDQIRPEMPRLTDIGEGRRVKAGMFDEN